MPGEDVEASPGVENKCTNANPRPEPESPCHGFYPVYDGGSFPDGLSITDGQWI